MPDLPGNFWGMFGLNPCRQYGSPAALFEGLVQRKMEAVQCLFRQTKAKVCQFLRENGLPEHLLEDVQSKALQTFYRNLDSGGYQFTGSWPNFYFLKIAQFDVLNLTRSKHWKKPPEPLTESDGNEETEKEQEARLRHQKIVDRLERLLAKLGKSCQHIIRLFYLDGYADQEAIDLKLVEFANTKSLKAARSRCMKTLRNIGFDESNDPEDAD